MQQALDYLGLGYSPIPIMRGEKFPTLKWAEYQKRKATQAEITRWFTEDPDSNVGIVTGKISGITVIDVDGPEGLHSLDTHAIVLPATYVVRSPKGMHFYYKYQPAPYTVAGLLPNVDVRNDGAVICAPPSKTANGTYEVHRNLPLGVLGDALPAHRKPVLGRSDRADNWLVDLLDKGAPLGQRNGDLARLSGYFQSRNIPMDVIQAVMRCWNDSRCSPPLPESELESVVHSVGRYAKSNPFHITEAVH